MRVPRKVLVFGATGEIGGRIARGCVEAGHAVTGVTRGNNRRAHVDVSGVEMMCGDKNDEAFIRDVLAIRPFDAIINSVPTAEDIKLYHRYFKQVQNIFICSSTGTFVPLRYFPADEQHPWREKTAVNFWSQCERDLYALNLWEQEQFPVTILRPTNIIGPDRVPLELWGGRDIGFFKTLKSGAPVDLPPCEHVLVQSGYNADLAGAFVKALDYPDAVRGEIFIISCKRAITLGRYLRTAMEFLKSKSEIRHVSLEKLMKLHPGISWKGLGFFMEHMCFDIGKAERTFGYAPTHTAEEGLIEALEWCASSGLL